MDLSVNADKKNKEEKPGLNAFSILSTKTQPLKPGVCPNYENISKSPAICILFRQSLVSSLHTGHREDLKSIFSECSKNPVESIRLIQALIKEMGEKFCDDYVSQADEKVLTMEIARELMQLSESIYYKILEDIILDERRRLPGTDLSGILQENMLHQLLITCCLEIVLFSYNSHQHTFPWILEVFSIEPFYFYKIIEVVIRTEDLSLDVVKHLNHVEEQIIESTAWRSLCPLWEILKSLKDRIPSCEEVSPISQLQPATSSSLFFRKFYHLASARLKDLCNRLELFEDDLLKKMWTCFEFSVMNHSDLMKDRHLDQILMCAVYVICNGNDRLKKFSDIIECYRTQSHASSHVYRSVLICTASSLEYENRGDLIRFYNMVYVPRIKNFALQFLNRNRLEGALPLSPLPLQHPSRRIVSPKHKIYITPLIKGQVIPRSPLSILYSFNGSRLEVLQANAFVHESPRDATDGQPPSKCARTIENAGAARRISFN